LLQKVFISLQLKRIGNKYKQQAVEAEKKREEAEKEKQEALNKLKEGQGKVSEVEMKQIHEKLTKAETNLAAVTEKLGAAESEKNQMIKDKGDLETKLAEAALKVTTLEDVSNFIKFSTFIVKWGLSSFTDSLLFFSSGGQNSKGSYY